MKKIQTNNVIGKEHLDPDMTVKTHKNLITQYELMKNLFIKGLMSQLSNINIFKFTHVYQWPL